LCSLPPKRGVAHGRALPYTASFYSLHRTSPYNLSGGLCLEHRWFFRKGIDALARFGGRLFDDEVIESVIAFEAKQTSGNRWRARDL